MNTAHQAATESGVAAVVKLAPPATISVSTLAGVPVNEVLLWATLIYTGLMIGHKLLMIWRDIVRKEPPHDA